MSLLGSGSYHMTGRFARPLANSSSKPGAGEPKCQKCLQTGHWTYECKGQAAYRSRASASKQLMNPAKRKYLNPEEVPEWMRYSKKALEEKQKQEAEARRKERKKKRKASSSSSSSGSDMSTSSGSGTTSTSTSGSSSSGTTTSGSSSDTSSSGGTSSNSSSSDSSRSSETSSRSTDSGRRSPPPKRTKRSPPRAAAFAAGRDHARQHTPAEDRYGGSGAEPGGHGHDAGGGRYMQALEPAEERLGTNGRQHSPPLLEGRRPDGRADGRAAAAAADRGAERDSRQGRGERLERSRNQRPWSPSPTAAGHEPAHRHGRSPGRWGGGEEQLQRQTSGARHAAQRLAATAAGQRGRHVRSLVAAVDRHRDGQYDEDEHHRRHDARDGNHRRVSGDRHWDRNDRGDHRSRAGDHQYRHSRDACEPASRYQPPDDEQPRQSVERGGESGGYQGRQGHRAVSNRGAAQAADRQHQEPRGRHRSPSRSLSRSRSPTTSASRSRSSGGSSSDSGGSSRSSGSSSSSSSSGGSSNSSDKRGATAKQPLRRGAAEKHRI